MFRLSSLLPSNPFASPPPPSDVPQPSQSPVPASTMTGEDDAETAHLSGFPFLRLPLELREQIYSICFNPADHLVRNSELEAHGFYGGVYRWSFSLFYTNKQVYAESKKVWKRENVFVKIATPWPSAGMYHVYVLATDGMSQEVELEQDGSMRINPGRFVVNHISSEGLVPIVCTDAKADAFVDHHAVVQITAPFHGVVPEHTVVMLVDDLHLFTRTWYYSALSYPMLNERLSTTFILRNPRKNETQQHCNDKSEEGEDGEESKKSEEGLGVPIALQRKLLLPFEHVKGLHDTRIYGYASSVQAELARLQALPIPSLQEALESATDYMAAGDAALIAPNTDKHEAAHQALDLYKKAFHAIHILIHGRTRRVLADVFFHDSITAGRYAGQTGITVRVILRLKLVARTIAAYNQLAQWNESAFWGMRSANILDENLNPDFEAFLTEVLGGADVAQIYLRTAIAFWHMERNQEDWFGELIAYADDEMAGSGMLFEKAKRFFRFLPKEGARRELRGFGVPESVVEMFGDDRGRAAQEESESVVAEAGSVAGDDWTVS